MFLRQISLSFHLCLFYYFYDLITVFHFTKICYFHIGIDTIRSCDIDLTVTNDLLTAEDIIEQADSLVPCDSTSFENCVS